MLTSVPSCFQKRAKSASDGTDKPSNSSDMHISAKFLPKVCHVCQCWHWQNLEQQQHAYKCQNAVKSVPSLPVLALTKPQIAATCISVPNCCQKFAKSVSAGTDEYLGNDWLISAGTDLVLPSPMGRPYVYSRY